MIDQVILNHSWMRIRDTPYIMAGHSVDLFRLGLNRFGHGSRR